jgi:NAD(P)-dependent dehydrogenase (short-subunit alcohol dehydrogenase family)
MVGSHAQYSDLSGSAVVITGGAEGIGRAIAEAFLEQGAKVAILDIDAEAIARFQDFSADLIAQQVDLRDIPATRLALQGLVETIGTPHVLVNNAGHDARHTFEHVDVADWDERMAVNLRHLMFVSQALLPGMRRLGRGVILNMGSTAWMKGATNLIAYTTAKAAIAGFTRSLSREVGPDGIRVNAIAPGWVMTDRQLAIHATPEKRAANLTAQALPYELIPGDIASAALFLCSNAARAITGQTLIVDGGVSYG